jgi:hypothetical protein
LNRPAPAGRLINSLDHRPFCLSVSDNWRGSPDAVSP